MKTAYIFHDAFCDPTSDWYPRIQTQLVSMGYSVIIPNFPTPAGQSYSSWKAAMKHIRPVLDSETIMIGHGTGGIFALRYLEEISVRIHHLILVASYAQPLGHIGYDRVNETFLNHTFAWETIISNADVIDIISGQDDPFVPESHTQFLGDSLRTSPQVIPNGGHINRASGFTDCPVIIETVHRGLATLDTSIIVEASPQEIEISQENKTSVITDEIPTTSSPKPASSPVQAHTMYQDMSSLVNSNQGRVASSLLTKARTQQALAETKNPLSTSNSLYIMGTLAVLLFIGGISTVIIYRYLPSSVTTVQQDPASLIPAENHYQVPLLGKPSYEVRQMIDQQIDIPVAPGVLHDIYYTQGSLRASFTNVLESLEVLGDIPEILRDQFIPGTLASTPVFMHAKTTTPSGTGYALILPIARYDQAFAGFRAWEPTLLRDLGVFMNVPPAFLSTKVTTDTFQDEVIANRNIRMLRYTPAPVSPDSPEPISRPYQENESMLGYFFLNDRTVVIVNTPEIIPEILTRYANRQIYN